MSSRKRVQTSKTVIAKRKESIKHKASVTQKGLYEEPGSFFYIKKHKSFLVRTCETRKLGVHVCLF